MKFQLNIACIAFLACFHMPRTLPRNLVINSPFLLRKSFGSLLILLAFSSMSSWVFLASLSLSDTFLCPVVTSGALLVIISAEDNILPEAVALGSSVVVVVVGIVVVLKAVAVVF